MSDSSSQEGRYAPPGPPPISFEGFSTLNTQSERPSIEDDQCSWLDGFIPVGKGTCRTVPGVGQPILALGTTRSIVFFNFGNIGSSPICIAILSDGSIVQINTDTLVVSGVAGAGTITPVDGRYQVGVSQWDAQFIILVSLQPDGYFLWDGTTFYPPGASVPGFTTVPTGVSGTSVEIYQGRVWVSNFPTIEFTAPQSVTDFSTASGGGTFQSVDSFLRVGYVQLVQTNGFLYLLGDSSINYISGVTTSGSPATTTFSNQNADPEIGTVWPGTVDVFSRNIVFANEAGAFISYGGAVSKISDALDGIYRSAPLGSFIPSACKAILYGRHIWCLLLPVIDPIDGTALNLLFCWDGKKWWSTRQDMPLIMVQHEEKSSFLTAYGTDGHSIWPLFQNPSINFVKTMQSKLFAAPGGWGFEKSADRLWTVFKYHNTGSPAVTVAIDNEVQQNTNPVTLTPTSFAGFVVSPPQAIAQNGVLLGVTLRTNAADMSVLGVSLSPQIPQYRG